MSSKTPGRRVRSFLKYLYVSVLYRSGLLALARSRVRRRSQVAVLTLHRVLPDEEFARTSSLPGMIMRAKTFTALCEHLRSHYEVVLAERLGRISEQSLRPRVSVTFDDGWADTATVAAPIAEAHGVPFLVFVCPGLMGRRFPFWPERAAYAFSAEARRSRSEVRTFVENLKSMAPGDREGALRSFRPVPIEEMENAEPLNASFPREEMPRLIARGGSVGSHTCNHRILTQVTAEDARWELQESRDRLERELQRPCDTFAYPNGNHSDVIRTAVANVGYRLAFTTVLGLWSDATDPLLIPRINITESHVTNPLGKFSPAMFEYYVFWRARRATAKQTTTDHSGGRDS